MARTIDISSSTIVIRPSKTVKFENMMGGPGGGRGPGGKNVAFPGKEYQNVAKTVVLVGQSLKHININLRDIKKMMVEEKKLQKVRDAQATRVERERRLETRKVSVGGGTKAIEKAAAKAGGVLGALGGMLGGVATVAGAVVGAAGIKKLLDSNFVANVVGGFMSAVSSIVKAVQNVPASTLSKAGLAIGRFVSFVAAFAGARFTQAMKGLDQIIDDKGNLRFSLKGIVNLIAGIGGLALTFRYLKNPTRIVSDIASVIGFLGNIGQKTARMLPKGARAAGGSTPAAAARAASKAGYYDDAVAASIKNSKNVSLGARLRGMRMPMNWGGPDDVPGITRAARAGSEYMMGMGRAGLKGTAGLAGRGLGMGVGALRSAPGALMGGIGKLAGGTGKALGAGFKGIGGRIPILGSLLAGGLEYAESGNVGRAGGAAAGAGLGTAIGAGIGSVIPGAGTLVGGLAGGIIGEYLGKTIGEGVMSVFKGFDFGKTVMEPLSKSFKWITDSLQEPIRMFKDAFGIGENGAEKADSGFIVALKNIGKIVGIIAKVLIKGVVPVLQVAMGAIGKAIELTTWVIKGIVSAVSSVANFVGSIIDKIPNWAGGEQLKGLKAQISKFNLGQFLDQLNTGLDKQDWSLPVAKAKGGRIFGGKPTGDSVPAYLERGEYVMNRKAVAAIGPRNLDSLNFGMYPRFQSGGAVSRKEGWDKFSSMGKTAGAKHDQLVAAQWALESGWGSALSGRNNFFGIKAAPGESSTNHRTKEVINGKTVTVTAGFKNFNSPQDAVNHLVNQWYKDYKGYKGVNRAADASAAAHDLKKQGYATDPNYPGKLVNLMGGKGNVSGVAYTSGGSGSDTVAGGAGSPMPDINPFAAANFGAFANLGTRGYQSGGEVIEYLTGDKSHPGYRADHGGGNYHEHLAFKTSAQRNHAMQLLRSNGINIGSINTGKHAKGSYHYSNLAFDVPAAQVPVGQEPALSRKVRGILTAGGFTGLGGAGTGGMADTGGGEGKEPGAGTFTSIEGVTSAAGIKSITDSIYAMVGGGGGGGGTSGAGNVDAVMKFSGNSTSAPNSMPGSMFTTNPAAFENAGVSASSGSTSIANGYYDIIGLGVGK